MTTAVRRGRLRLAQLSTGSFMARKLIADEPTTALDVTTQAQILALLRRLQRERQIALMLITHDIGVIEHPASGRAHSLFKRMLRRPTRLNIQPFA